MPALAASKQVHYRVEQECHGAGMRPRILRELRVHRHCSLNADSAFFRRYRCIRRLNLAPVAACAWRIRVGAGRPAGDQVTPARAAATTVSGRAYPLNSLPARQATRCGLGQPNNSDSWFLPQRGQMNLTAAMSWTKKRVPRTSTARKSYGSPSHSSHTFRRRSASPAIGSSTNRTSLSIVVPLVPLCRTAQDVAYNQSVFGLLMRVKERPHGNVDADPLATLSGSA